MWAIRVRAARERRRRQILTKCLLHEIPMTYEALVYFARDHGTLLERIAAEAVLGPRMSR